MRLAQHDVKLRVPFPEPGNTNIFLRDVNVKSLSPKEKQIISGKALGISNRFISEAKKIKGLEFSLDRNNNDISLREEIKGRLRLDIQEAHRGLRAARIGGAAITALRK